MPELRTLFAKLNLSDDTNLTSTDTQMLLEWNRTINIRIISVLAAMIRLGEYYSCYGDFLIGVRLVKELSIRTFPHWC
jgi:hypothetical protein